MATLAEFRPLRDETIDTIRARIDNNVNAGLDVTDNRWQETVPGGFFYDHTQAMGLEAEYLWDFASTELPASFFLPFSWGVYLDYWGEMLDVPRKAPAAATGIVTLANSETSAQVVGAGLEVAAAATDPTADPLGFTTDAGVVVPAGGSIDVAITATDAGAAWNVAAGAVTLVTSPSQGLTVTNAAGITGGEDEELDEPYKTRLLLEFSGARGGGTQDDYTAETLALPSVGNVTVVPHYAGPNTVELIISDVNNQPLSPAVIESVQNYWDPPTSAGLGAGEAPIDAEVNVVTVTAMNVTVAAELQLEPGYTVGGAGGTVDVQPLVDAALEEYFQSLPAGRDVQLNRVIAVLLGIEGVYDVHPGSVLLDGVAADVAVAALDSAHLVTPTTLTSEPAPE